MTSTTEGATSKKRRADGDPDASRGVAASGGSAAAISDLDARLGSRLLLIKGLLESHPEELKGTIISLLKEMLSLRDTIRQRKESYARFSKPAKDPTTGVVLKDKESGEPLPFVPSFLRNQCPLKASAAMNNDPNMVDLLEEGAQVHANYVKAMTEQAEKVASLEITLRQKMLRTTLYNLLDALSLGKIIAAEIEDKQPDNMQLDRDSLIQLVGYGVLKSLPDATAKLLEVENGAGLAAEYEKVRGFDYEIGLKTFATDDGDIAFSEPIITQISAELPNLTTEVWKHEDKKDTDRKINAALRVQLQKKATADATADVQAALDEENTAMPSEQLNDLIVKKAKEVVDKQMVQLKRQMRKNSSGEDKSQPSKPGKNGQGLKSKSNAATSKKSEKKKKQPPKQDNTAKSSKKDKQDEATKPKTSNRPSKQNNRGSAGGSKGGGKRNGAGRR